MHRSLALGDNVVTERIPIMATQSPIRLEMIETIAMITFDQPESRANVLSTRVWAALGNAVAEVAVRNDLSGLLIRSAKEGIFLAGADLKELAELPIDDEDSARQVVENGLRVLAALEALTIPTAAAIDGACLGGGFEVALACDYRVLGTHPKVKVGLPEAKLGLTPGWGGTQRLPRIIGAANAAELLVTGSVLGADEAVKNGLADRVVPSDALIDDCVKMLLAAPAEDWETRRARKQSPYGGEIDLSSVRTLFESLTQHEKLAGEADMRALECGLPLPLTPAIECETREFVPLLLGPNSRRCIAAFLQKSVR
jgi:enoyl-CoA hydratase/carnithine racemase